MPIVSCMKRKHFLGKIRTYHQFVVSEFAEKVVKAKAWCSIVADICFIFPRKQVLTFHANCLLVTWNVKHYHLSQEKLKKKKKNVVCCSCDWCPVQIRFSAGWSIQGPVVWSILSLTSSLMVKMLIVLVSTISNPQDFCWKNVSSFCKCKSYSHFFSKNVSIYAIFNDQSFNHMLTNNIFSFEQLGPGSWVVSAPDFRSQGPRIESPWRRN